MGMDVRRLTINQIANDISISRERFENIVHIEFGMMKVSALLVPRFLISDQKRTRLSISREDLPLFEAELTGLLERFISQDNCWMHHKVTIHAVKSTPSSHAPKKTKVV